MYSDNPDSKSIPPHLILLFMATATIVDENEAVSGPVFPVQFLTKKKVSFLSLLFPLFPFFSGHYYFHLCARYRGERGGGTQSLNQENGRNGDGRGRGGGGQVERVERSSFTLHFQATLRNSTRCIQTTKLRAMMCKSLFHTKSLTYHCSSRGADRSIPCERDVK